MPLVIVVIGIILLLVLITGFKINPFISFILVSLFVGIAEGLPLLETVDAIQKGIGATLGSLVLILGFGAMLGKMVADSGAAQKITGRLVKSFGLKNVHWALMITGFIVGIPMFYTVGFVIMVPLVFAVAAQTRLPLLFVGLPMLASLSVTHGYLPPHPAPTAIAEMFQADIGFTLLYGLLVAIPAAVLVVPIFSRRVKSMDVQPLKEFTNTELVPEEDLPSTFNSLTTALLPVILIAAGSLVKIWSTESSMIYQLGNIVSNPVLALLASVIVAIFSLGLRKRDMKTLMDSLAKSITGITMVFLIIGGAGSLKEVLVASGVSDYLGSLLSDSGLNPLILAWLIAAAIRVSVGSATVAGLTAAGIVLPLVSTSGVAPELMVLSIGAGSIFMSHVNDGGFWLFKEYFNLSVKDTLKTWTLMETSVSITGLVGVLVLQMIL